jgi:hypothetical protein
MSRLAGDTHASICVTQLPPAQEPHAQDKLSNAAAFFRTVPTLCLPLHTQRRLQQPGQRRVSVRDMLTGCFAAPRLIG